LQQIHSIPVAKLERKLGALTDAEFRLVLERLRERFAP
jgi:mRNA-degrading endonuclease toxin of MazEF toxin-antitoxin module